MVFTTVLTCTLINIGILSIMYLVFRKKLEKAVTASSLVEHVRREIDELVVELNHTTDRNIELIEERIGRLNKLLKDADNRIVVLNRQQERPAVKDTYEDVVRPRPGAERKAEDREPTVKEKVLLLSGQGFDNAVIAGRLGLTLGEVDLIVSLETRRESMR